MGSLGEDNNNYRHGHANGGKTSGTYNSWRGLRDRCTNPKHKNYSLYKDRLTDKRWLVFENFLADMGERPEGTTLDRIDNEQGYCKENCRWASPSQQHRNHSRNIMVTLQEETKCLKDWAIEMGLNYGTVVARVRKGWEPERALLTPVRRKK